MRISFVSAAILISTMPAWPQDIPEHMQAGLRALLTASLAAKQCDGIEIDPDRFEAVAGSYGIDTGEILGRYKGYSDAFTNDLLKEAQADPDKFCALALKTFGPDGAFPGVLGID